VTAFPLPDLISMAVVPFSRDFALVIEAAHCISALLVCSQDLCHELAFGELNMIGISRSLLDWQVARLFALTIDPA
jgi:hypothetical protein